MDLLILAFGVVLDIKEAIRVWDYGFPPMAINFIGPTVSAAVSDSRGEGTLSPQAQSAQAAASV